MLHQFFLCYLKNERLRKSKSGANYLDEYFPVSSQLLRRTCTDNYKLYVDALIEAGIIECNVNKMGGKSYLPGSHAQLYRWLGISPYAFRSETITERAVIKSVLRTRDMYAKKCKEIAFELSDDNQVYSYMLACCNEVVLPDLHSRKEIESDLGVLEVEAFLTGNLNWFKVDSFGRRLHTPVSSMLKKTRKQLRFKSHPDTELVTLDIRNSQPFFSSVFMSKNLILTHLPEFTPIIPLIEDYERKPDFRLYRRLCVEGRLYEFLLESIGENPNDQIARDKVKELFFSAVLFSRTRVFGEQSRFREHFRRAFPSVHDMFQRIKKLGTDTLPLLDDIIRPTGKRFKYAKSNDSYKLIACLLQRSESAMVYKVIAPKLMSAGVPFLTVHDSFIALPGDAEFIQEAIKQSFDELSLPVPVVTLQ